MIHVIDSSALGEVPRAVTHVQPVLDAFGDLVAVGELRFCNDVRDALRARGPAAVSSWARQIHRNDKGPDYSYFRFAAESVPALVDEDSDDSEPVAVLAHALCIRDADEDVTVVTEDNVAPPTRLDLRSACDCVGLPCADLRELLRRCNLTHLLRRRSIQ